MTAPIDLSCPTCEATPGNYCHENIERPWEGRALPSYHNARIDGAFRETAKRTNDPRALRAALQEALDRLAERATATTGDLSFVDTTREAFDL